MHITSRLIEMGCFVKKTGSQVICSPPPDNSDTDYLVRCHDLEEIKEVLDKQGFESESEEYEDQENAFVSYRKGSINLILTEDVEFAKKHCLATEVCKKLNLLKKEDRIMVFKAILYNERPTGENNVVTE